MNYYTANLPNQAQPCGLVRLVFSLDFEVERLSTLLVAPLAGSNPTFPVLEPFS